LILTKAAGCNGDGPCTITSSGDSVANMDGTVGSSIGGKTESRTGKQVRGAILDFDSAWLSEKADDSVADVQFYPSWQAGLAT
jgi:hypothetical protein